jgi:hypothetical protein
MPLFNNGMFLGATPITKAYLGDSLVFEAGGGGEDWDTEAITYFNSSAGAVSYIFNVAAWDTLQASGNPAAPMSTATSGSSIRMKTTVSGGWNSNAVSTAFPHVYIWTMKYGWDKAIQVTVGNNKPNIDHSGVNHPFAYQEDLPQCAYAFYADDQGDISGWNAYDGPTSSDGPGIGGAKPERGDPL